MTMKGQENQLKAIEAAVQKAELKTSGEIVPVISDKCSNTTFVFPLIFLSCLSLAIVLQQIYFPFNHWDHNIFWQVSLPVLFLFLLSLGLSKIYWVQRFFIPKRYLEKEVQEQAELEFYRWVNSKTKDKTGILLFVSLMERYSVVLADTSISQKLPPETWTEVLQILNSQMSQSDLARGFVPAIEKCRELLSQHFPRDPNDTDELPNYPILRRDDS